MYKVLIADDERTVRYGLSRAIPWNELGFEVVGAVVDGSEVLEFIENNPVDVLLTDIKMHKVDGLTAAKEISERFPNIKIMILSGYSEVDYLHDAIRSKVVAYLNKPTDRDELQNEFKKLKNDLDEENNIKSERERLREYLNESLPYMREIIFFKILSGDVVADENIKTKMNFYGIYMPPSEYHVVILKIDNDKYIEDAVSAEKWYLIYKTIVYLACGIFESQNFFYDRNNELVAGICENENIIEKIENLQEKIQELKHGISLSATVSTQSISVYDIKNKYDEAMRAIKLKAFFGDEAIVLYEEVAQLFSESLPGFTLETSKIIKAVFNKDEKTIISEVTALFSKLEEDGMTYLEYTGRICIEVLFEVEKVFGLSDGNFNKYMKSRNKNIFDIIKFEDMADMKAWFLNTLIEFSHFSSTELCRKISKLVRNGMLYINNNYTDNNISLNSVAETLNKNPTYFSHVFKTETGKTFSEYIRTLRIEKAKQLLRESNMKIYEISQAVGYLDITTLTRIFKKVVGVSPNDYRNISINNKDGETNEHN